MEDRSVLSRPAALPAEVVAYGPRAEQLADIYHGRDGRARPLVILIHGGFWRPDYDRVHLRPMAAALAAAGWTVALPEYARLPGAPGPMLADVGLALRQLPERVGRHGSRLLLVGHSAGGHLALWAAAARVCAALDGVLALAPVADLQRAYDLKLDDGAVEAFLGRPPAAWPELDPCRMRTPRVAVTLVQGQEDTLVPPAVTDSYAAAHPAVRVARLPGVGHYELIDPLSPAWPVVVAELARLAAAGP